MGRAPGTASDLEGGGLVNAQGVEREGKLTPGRHRNRFGTCTSP